MYIDEFSIYCDDTNSTFSNSTYDDDTITSNKKNKKTIDDIKKLDSGYHKIKLMMNRKRVSIEYYETNITPGSRIRDAITGIKYKDYRVGTTSEYLFFKVCNVLPETKSRNSHILFFDDPVQYERHFKCELDQKIKDEWKEKRDLEWSNYEKQNNNYNKMEYISKIPIEYDSTSNIPQQYRSFKEALVVSGHFNEENRNYIEVR